MAIVSDYICRTIISKFIFFFTVIPFYQSNAEPIICMYKDNQTVNPNAACEKVFVQDNIRDADTIFVADLSHLTAITELYFDQTGITTLPDIRAINSTLLKLSLLSNDQLAVIPSEILGQMQALVSLTLSGSPLLTQIPDVPLVELQHLTIKGIFGSIPYLPVMGETITVSLKCLYKETRYFTVCICTK